MGLVRGGDDCARPKGHVLRWRGQQSRTEWLTAKGLNYF